MQRFRTNYPAGANIPTGALLNAYGEALNTAGGGFGGGGLNRDIRGNFSAPPGLLIGLAEITDAADTGTQNPDGTYNAPKSSQALYLAKFRHFQHRSDADPQQGWRKHDQEVEHTLDAGGFHGGVDNKGPIPKFANFDVVPAMYEPIRNCLIPLQGVPQPIGSITYRAEQSITLEKKKSAAYEDTAAICLELSHAGTWSKFMPELSLAPGGCGRGASAAMTVVVALRHYDTLRMTGATSKHSTTQLVVFEHGLTIIPLARMNPNEEQPSSGMGEMTGASSNFQVLQGLAQVTTSPLRFKDSPTFTPIPKDKVLRVEMVDPAHQWLCAITYWAEVFQAGPGGAWLRIAHVNADNSLKPAGTLLKPIDVGGTKLHPATIEHRDAEGTLTSQSQKAYVLFRDYPTDGGNVVAEQGRIYGPCQFIGVSEEQDQGEEDGESADDGESSGAPDTERPVFAAHIGDQEYLAKPTGTSVSKGATGDFELYSRDEQATGIIQAAKALAGEIPESTPKKWCIVKRLNRQWYASRWEC
jgi:hypothetical protein